MTSTSNIRRQIKQAAAKRELNQRTEQTISAADHFTAADRAVAEALEASELFAEFAAEELDAATSDYTHTEVMSFDVRLAFANSATAGRVVSGLLKAAVKRGEIKTKTTGGRVSGWTVWYVMTEKQLAGIRAEAIKRGGKTLRQSICKPVTVQQAAALLA